MRYCMCNPLSYRVLHRGGGKVTPEVRDLADIFVFLCVDSRGSDRACGSP